ncbi:hypothetical protein G6F42_021263 [Rhizopus arrhizus]|nr:hypothetical protein G6F42_021263 [Rhizopus arrhizus]
MTEIGAMAVDMLSNTGHCFWNHCNSTDATPNVESTSIDNGFLIPISDFYALIDKSRNKARGMSSRY